MVRVQLKPLLKRLNYQLTNALEAAAGLCVSRSHYEVTIEHLLLKLAEDPAGDVQTILRHYEIEPANFNKALQRAIEGFRSGNPGKPVFSPHLVEWFQDAWLLASVEFNQSQLRSGALVLSLAMNPSRTNLDDFTDALERIKAEDLRKNFLDVLEGSAENAAQATAEGEAAPAGAKGAAGRDPASALARFTQDFTGEARAGRIDPVFERDREIRQVIDILARRRKNNPIIVGDAGVGKSALVEGLALRIVSGDVPDFLRDVELLGLDLGLLQAGAGMKGEFEGRLKSVLTEVKASAKPIILFIDEAHTLIGAGGSAGGSDAANLLKPALARGELRTIAATTWSEYKKYFERDPALSRRFQVVKCDEPSELAATAMLRGLCSKYEDAHKVRIREDAIVAAARLASRYISGRQLPDKAVDLLDTAAARVRVSMTGKPVELDDAERKIITIRREIDALRRDQKAGMEISADSLRSSEKEVENLERKAAEVTERWIKEKAIADQVIEITRQIQGESSAPANGKAEKGADGASEPKAPAKSAEELQRDLAAALEALKQVRGKDALVHTDVNPEVVAKVVADWTGIPIGNMVRDEAASVLRLEDDLLQRIKGQDHALGAIAKGVRAAKAGLANPNAPMAVYLLVGPSGVGKTETALSVAQLLFGGERFMVTINMSEFQEKHTLSRLVGSPPGYVGYGEGGVLTEAVRQRPYSVVLLDECEKASLDVMNLFYQVFDKGMLADGEGRVIDFKNTIIFLTSNLATDEIMALAGGATPVSAEELGARIRPVLSKHFKPALLARMTVVPYFPLAEDAMLQIVEAKLNRIGDRMMATHHMRFDYDKRLVESIAQRCNEVETGARNIDHILNGTLLPRISTAILERMSEAGLPGSLTVSLDESDQIQIAFDQATKEAPRPAETAPAG